MKRGRRPLADGALPKNAPGVKREHPARAKTTPVPSGVDALQRFVAADVHGAVDPVVLRSHAVDESLDSVFRKHMVDFRTSFDEMRKQPPSVVFFGGARLKPGEPHYALAEAFGRVLAERGIPPKTGRGPGAMEAVPAEFIEARDHRTAKVVQSVVGGVSRLAHLDDQRTLGFNIILPKEQAPSPAIENGGEIQNFAFRKFALYENVRGVVVLPGGFGTMDELMEVLVLKKNGRTHDPVVLAGTDYWQPILDAWRTAAQRNGADLLAGLLDEVLVTDNPHVALDYIEGQKGVRSFEEDPDVLYKRMVREIKLARYVAVRQDKAVTVLGGNRLRHDDPALSLIADLAGRIDQAGEPLRVGEEGQVERAVVAAAGDVQRVLWSEDPSVHKRSDVDVDDVRFHERVPQKEVLLRNASAYVVLPDAARGKDELCTVLCQIQTGKLPKRPIVLVDSAFWKPIVDAWTAQMLGPDHAYIAPDDVSLISYADTADQAFDALASVLP